MSRVALPDALFSESQLREGAAIAAALRAQYPDPLPRAQHNHTALAARQQAAACATQAQRHAQSQRRDTGAGLRRVLWAQVNVLSHKAIEYIEQAEERVDGDFQAPSELNAEWLEPMPEQGNARALAVARDRNEMARMLRDTHVNQAIRR